LRPRNPVRLILGELTGSPAVPGEPDVAVGGGLAIISLRVALLAGPGMLGGAAFVALGVTAIGYEITMAAGRHAGRQIPGGLAAMAGGSAVIGLGPPT
jgi:hypothetical protein